MITKLYPLGRKKAFNITYDDGVTQDVRFVKLLNKYNLKGTFNLNSQLMQQHFEWVHESGLVIKRLSPERVAQLYNGHEIASHTLTHPYMHDMGEEEIIYQMLEDKKNLEQLSSRPVAGFAVPFSYYSPLIASCAEKCGFEYARCSDERYSYTPPENHYWWAAGAFHLNPAWRQFANDFFTCDRELALCQIVGHSYDLDTENMWEEMEGFLARVSADENIISMTNIQLARYLKAMAAATVSDGEIINHSNITLWFDIDGKTVELKPGEKIDI